MTKDQSEDGKMSDWSSSFNQKLLLQGIILRFFRFKNI